MKQRRSSMIGGLIAALAGMGLIGVVLAIAIAFFAIGLTLYGLWLAFSASIILGIIVLFVEPSPFIIGAVMFFWDKNLAQMLIDFLNQ